MAAGDPSLISLLYSAMESPCGVIIATEEPERLRQKLYKLKRENPAFAALAFQLSPTNPTSELWIVKRDEDGPGQEDS